MTIPQKKNEVLSAIDGQGIKQIPGLCTYLILALSFNLHPVSEPEE